MTVLGSHVRMAGHALMGSTVTHAAVWMDMKEHIVRLVGRLSYKNSKSDNTFACILPFFLH